MNKLSVEQTELATEELSSTVDFSTAEIVTRDEFDRILREARIAQSEFALHLIKAGFKFIGRAITAIQNGLRAATAYDELARLSDRELADIGVSREEIAGIAYRGCVSTETKAELAVYSNDVKVTRSKKEWLGEIAA